MGVGAQSTCKNTKEGSSFEVVLLSRFALFTVSRTWSYMVGFGFGFSLRWGESVSEAHRTRRAKRVKRICERSEPVFPN
jgi:hypothetical protein